MAKEPQTIERYRVHCEVESAESMGVLVAQLTRMGMKGVGFELITEVSTYKNRKVHDVSMEKALAAYIKEHPTFQISDVRKHFAPEGRSSGAVYTAARVLVDKGELKALGDGNYSAAHVKHIEGPKKQSKAGKHAKTGKFKTTGRDEILKFIRPRKMITIRQLRDLFSKQGRTENSVSPIVDAFCKKKVLKKTGTLGEYIVVKPAAKPAAKRAAVEKTNGAEAPAVMEQANG